MLPDDEARNGAAHERPRLTFEDCLGHAVAHNPRIEARAALEVRDARRHLDEAESTLAGQGQVIEQAEKALEIARVRYTSGLGTELEVTGAQLALAEARVVRLRALAERAVAGAELRFAGGQTLYPEGALP